MWSQRLQRLEQAALRQSEAAGTTSARCATVATDAGRCAPTARLGIVVARATGRRAKERKSLSIAVPPQASDAQGYFVTFAVSVLAEANWTKRWESRKRFK